MAYWIFGSLFALSVGTALYFLEYMRKGVNSVLRDQEQLGYFHLGFAGILVPAQRIIARFRAEWPKSKAPLLLKLSLLGAALGLVGLGIASR